MSSRPEHPTHTTGALRSRTAAPRRHRPQTDGGTGRPRPRDRDEPHDHPESEDRYEPWLDGLFTYCLSVLCEHDTAAAVLGETLALAERQHGRRPADPALFGPWLYALARWACLRRLAEQADAPEPDDPPGARDDRRQRELAALAWPEAAGTTPEQREVLELSVRHRLAPDEIAAVTGAEPAATRTLLAAAACEVERTRAALAVVEFGRCPDVARLAGDGQMLLGAALRRELVRHVDDCAECRRTAERATAAGPWPGTAPADQGALPLVPADRAAVGAALAAARSTRSGRAEGVPGAVPAAAGRSGGANGSPRYDRRGFPRVPTDRTARRRRLRHRALTTTVVATVLAAPVLALWAAYRNAPEAGASAVMPTVAADDAEGAGSGGRLDGGRYENAGNARPSAPRPGSPAGDGAPDVSVSVLDPYAGPTPPGGREEKGPGRLTVAAQPAAGTTVITISASGGTPVRWRATAGAPWLQMSHTAGQLRPGQSTTITVYVDHDREPEGHWRSVITIEPGGTVVTLDGHGAADPAPQHGGPGGPAHPPAPRPSGAPPRPAPSPSSGHGGPSAPGGPSGPGDPSGPAGPSAPSHGPAPSTGATPPAGGPHTE
ncbi:sigma-70 family RNA polymerase sigma factor [Streptomyces sp. RS10V-4]|uniref:BACON domain-containing protein n=1 Tax=Streptomyces rhizoryzae TaxID=2932493 RepID=UPI0020032C2C|nr:sigma-70 family RNA polymerase sigma factor [Streptomyces rhizoryzae]MCK7627338.1 sigma-70 family RNA polymerase sigma factor [Streptomyces rhizoryzae]